MAGFWSSCSLSGRRSPPPPGPGESESPLPTSTMHTTPHPEVLTLPPRIPGWGLLTTAKNGQHDLNFHQQASERTRADRGPQIGHEHRTYGAKQMREGRLLNKLCCLTHIYGIFFQR